MEHIQKFISGGIAVLGVTYLSEKIGPRAGAIFYSFPLIFLTSLFFLYQKNISPKNLIELSGHSAISLINIIFLMLTFKYGFQYFTDNKFNYAFLLSILVGVLVWSIGTIILNYFI